MVAGLYRGGLETYLRENSSKEGVRPLEKSG